MKTRAPLAATVKTRPRLEPAACGLPLRPRVTAPRAAPEEKNLRLAPLAINERLLVREPPECQADDRPGRTPRPDRRRTVKSKNVRRACVSKPTVTSVTSVTQPSSTGGNGVLTPVFTPP